MLEEISPQIEEEIIDLLDGSLKETALRFVSYLRTNHLTPRQWFGPTYWRIPYGEYYLCSILLNKNKWRVFFFAGDYSGDFEEDFIKAVQDSVKPCISCTGDDCPKGKPITVFGREFADACFQFPVQFVNPNNGNLESIKGLLEHWKRVAPYSDSWHCH